MRFPSPIFRFPLVDNGSRLTVHGQRTMICDLGCHKDMVDRNALRQNSHSSLLSKRGHKPAH